MDYLYLSSFILYTSYCLYTLCIYIDKGYYYLLHLSLTTYPNNVRVIPHPTYTPPLIRGKRVLSERC